ncbi:MAG: hypothetical protein QXX03_05675 [Nitrososphaerota archaeon]
MTLRHEIYRDVLSKFNVDEYGLITNPGKFERQPLFVPYYYTLSLIGAHDKEITKYGFTFYVFKVADYEKIWFPALSDVKNIYIYEDEYGFVNYLTKKP